MQSISREIVDYNIGKLEIELPTEIVETAITTNRDFFVFLGNSLNLSDEAVTVEFNKWYKKVHDQTQSQADFASLQEDISSLVKPYAETRLRLMKTLTKISIEHRLSI